MIAFKAAQLLSLVALTLALPTVQEITERTISIPLLQRPHSANKRDVSLSDARNILQAQLSQAKSKMRNARLAYEKNTGKPAQSSNTMPLAASGEPLPTVRLPKLNTRATEIVSTPLEFFEPAFLVTPFWFADITVGSNQQNFSVQLDLATADTILGGVNCDNSCFQAGRYDPDGDTTAVNTTFCEAFRCVIIMWSDLSFTTVYNIFDDTDPESSTGFIFTDDITLNGLTAHDQAFGVATHISSDVEVLNSPISSRIGLAFEAATQLTETTFLSTLVAQKDVKPTFAFRLSRNATSEFTLGGVNPAQFTGDPRKATLAEFNGLYSVGITKVFLDGEAVVTHGKGADNNFTAILHSATAFIFAPMATAAFIYSKVDGAQDLEGDIGPGFFTFPCESPPTLSFELEGPDKKNPFVIDPSIFNLGVFQEDNCLGALAGDDSLDEFSNEWILGTGFLENFYTAIDMKNVHISFATLSQVEE